MRNPRIGKSSVRCSTIPLEKIFLKVQLDPISHKSDECEKAGVILSYDTLGLVGITLNSFYLLLKLINIWEINRKNANVKLRTKNGSEFILSNLSVDEAREIYEKLQQEDN